MTDPMTDERLAEIEAEHARPTRTAYDNHDQLLTLADAVPELIAEVRRLRGRERLLAGCLEQERLTGDEWRMHAKRDQHRAEKAEAEVERLREGALRFRAVIHPDFDADAFGGYLVGSAPAGEAVIAIPFEAIFDSCAQFEVRDWAHLASEIVVHEMLHAVQDLLGLAFSEVDVDGAIERARSAYGEQCFQGGVEDE